MTSLRALFFRLFAGVCMSLTAAAALPLAAARTASFGGHTYGDMGIDAPVNDAAAKHYDYDATAVLGGAHLATISAEQPLAPQKVRHTLPQSLDYLQLLPRPPPADSSTTNWLLSVAANNAIAAGGGQAAAQQALRPDVLLSGGRSGQLVKSLVGPPSSVVRGGGARACVTNEQGQVILDITTQRVKPVIPGQGFGPKRPPTGEELDLLGKIFGGGQ